ncbi:MAG: hypothetical protein WDA27_02915 [Actinomycetota bacterium]
MLEGRYRVTAGFGLVFAGVIVAVAGYLGVSAETQVAFQLPYFASAGVGGLMLLGFGSAMLLSAQLERDTDRVDQLEEAVRQLANEVARLADDLTPRRGTVLNSSLAEEDVNGGARPVRKVRQASVR